VILSFSKPKENYSRLTEVEYRKAFDEYFVSLRNFLYFKTSDEGLSEDLAQDAFVKLWENRDRIDKKTLKSYLYTIGGNLAINYMKRRQLQFKFQRVQTDRNSKETPEFLMQMREYEQKLKEVIALMPDGSREVFLMNRLEDMKYKEIAERLGISVKAIEKRMSKALKIVKEQLGVSI